MTEIILSVRPEYCRKILSGEKIVEVRKNKPSGLGPYKVYLYETKLGCGGVVGECECFCTAEIKGLDYITAESCLTPQQVTEYAGGRKIYAWYLSKVKKYGKTKPLSEFGLKKAPQSWRYMKRGDTT